MALQKNSKKKQIRLGYANPVSTLRVKLNEKPCACTSLTQRYVDVDGFAEILTTKVQVFLFLSKAAFAFYSVLVTPSAIQIFYLLILILLIINYDNAIMTQNLA